VGFAAWRYWTEGRLWGTGRRRHRLVAGQASRLLCWGRQAGGGIDQARGRLQDGPGSERPWVRAALGQSGLCVAEPDG